MHCFTCTLPTPRQRVVAGLLCLLASTAALSAQQDAQQFSLPDGVAHKAVNVWSDGTRLSGDLFYPATKSDTSALPAVVLSHGWGGTRDHLNRAYAPFIAESGIVALTIDYRGWGESDSKLVLVGEQPELDELGQAPVVIKAAREIVDPLDQTEDIQNAVRWLRGEPGVDARRIGLWGTSYSGGHVVWVAAHDHQIRATVSQVGAQDSVNNYPRGRAAGNSALFNAVVARSVPFQIKRRYPASAARPTSPGWPTTALATSPIKRRRQP